MSGKTFAKMNPLTILREAIKAVPALKYAFGLLGLVAVAAIVAMLKVEPKIAVFGTVVILILMVAVVVFARLTTLDTGILKYPAIVFLWSFTLLTVATGGCLFSVATMGKPKFFAVLLLGNRTDPVLPEVPQKEQAIRLPANPGKIVLTVTTSEVRTDTMDVVSPQRRVDSSSDDHDQTVTSDPIPAGWSVVPGSVHVPITWAQGKQNHDWWLDNIRENPIPAVHVRTEHHGLGTSGKIEFHFEYKLSRRIEVPKTEDKNIELSWGQIRVEPIVPQKWVIHYTPPDGPTQEIIGPYKMSFIEIKPDGEKLVLSAPAKKDQGAY